VECRNIADLFCSPAHAYTRKLISALPVVPRFAAAAVGSVVV
jgi:ABC-type oligopeptide transport system ATPase subunit